jgi:uncharacterized protein (TIGR02246 family)
MARLAKLTGSSLAALVWVAFSRKFRGITMIVEQRKTGASLGVIVVALSIMAFGAPARADARADIRALEERFVAAFKAKDVDAIMKVYAPDQTLVVFDVVPPRQYVGAAAYRKDWQTFLDSFEGPITVELTDLDVGADRNLAYSHSIQRVAGTDKQGKKLDLTVRVTDVYKKDRGRWILIHEHVSVPVDLDTGKPDLTSKP